jgi:hypothetical protein
MKLLYISAGILAIGNLSASEVKWTARGTVTSVSGAAFSGTGTTAGHAVEIVLVYDSNTFVDGRTFLPINGALAGRAWFTGAADLGIHVKIGDNTWSGEMPVVPAGTNVMESVCWDFGGSPDTFVVTLDSARGGSFPSFPHAGNESVRALKLDFRDETSPAELFDVHVLPDSVTKVCAMTKASGSVVAGSSTLSFTLDPSTVHITQPRVPVTLVKDGNSIHLSWQSEVGIAYRIEGSSDLRCWSEEAIQSGNGLVRQQTLTPFATHPKRFYRIVER